ncbi:MAG TPA: hypothetical protein EYQ25_06365 [Planctomycetes bacterium]|nr:hypothetical protein [Planctomycetota bacterium]HIL37348.1 hypothetical protein [Planctomycetota bacterium]
MNRLYLSSLGLAALCLALPLNLTSNGLARVAASGISAFQDGDVQPAPEQEETDLDRDMLEVKAQVRLLRRSLRSPDKNEASLKSLQILETHVLAAKGRAPRNTQDLPEAERAAYVLSYRADMLKFLSIAIAVESALIAGDQDGAQEHFKAFREQEDPAHEKFTDEG